VLEVILFSLVSCAFFSLACIAGESDGWFLGYNKLGSLTQTDALQLVRGGMMMMMMMMI
jgi:hypothetical protein